MALRSFDVQDLPPGRASSTSPVSRSVPPPSQSRLFLVSSGEWGWEELRDYVVNRIEKRWGPQRRDPLKEASIFRSFVKRWGRMSEPISRYAFEIADGFWMGDPITINRWAKGSDPYFAAVIVKKLS
jgi:hypothetical protein